MVSMILKLFKNQRMKKKIRRMKKVRSSPLGNLNMMMGPMKVNIDSSEKDGGDLLGLMVGNIRVIGMMTRSVDLDFINGQINKSTMENTNIIKSMELAKLYNPIPLNI